MVSRCAALSELRQTWLPSGCQSVCLCCQSVCLGCEVVQCLSCLHENCALALLDALCCLHWLSCALCSLHWLSCALCYFEPLPELAD